MIGGSPATGSHVAQLPTVEWPSDARRIIVTFQVFQVDPSAELEPFAQERSVLQSAGGTLILGGCRTEDEIIERAGTPDVLWLTWKPGITHRVLEALPSVRLAIRWGVGYEQMDVEAATEARRGHRQRARLRHR